jgi:hypothetical protein
MLYFSDFLARRYERIKNKIDQVIIARAKRGWTHNRVITPKMNSSEREKKSSMIEVRIEEAPFEISEILFERDPARWV